MKILVTGAAGFIGMHACMRLLEDGHEVIGLDNLNDYYDPALKNYRLAQLAKYKNFYFVRLDLADRSGIAELFEKGQFQRVVHLAAQAGVRHSIEAPFDYIDSNIVGMLTILEGCRKCRIEHLVYASSSSVYGANSKIPFSETDNVDNPVSLYAATKKSNELMACAYSKLYGIPATGLRFFTVYGPAGRPDMAPWLFTEAILTGKPIKVFNQGIMQRDFTYIDDIIEALVRVLDVVPAKTSENNTPHRVLNIGRGQPVGLETFISAIEQACGKAAVKIYMDIQPGDVPITYADTASIEKLINFKPEYPLELGVKNFINWYKKYFNKA